MKGATTLRHLAPLFRGPFLRKLATGRYYPELTERLESGGQLRLLELPLGEVFERVYDLLLKGYRCEYVFKNTLTQHFLAGSLHGDGTHITDEFRVGKSRVDLAVFSDTSFAYEIKTEFDSSVRLQSQATEYVKLFDRVFVVTTEKLRPKIEPAIPKSVGVLELSTAGKFTTIRDSDSHSNTTDLNVAFDCLRQDERLVIVEAITGMRVQVPTSKLYLECKKRFRRLLPFEAQQHVLRYLRERRFNESSATLLSEVPPSLKHAALTLRATRREIDLIRQELKKVPQQPTTNQDKQDAHILPLLERKTARDDRAAAVKRAAGDRALSEAHC